MSPRILGIFCAFLAASDIANSFTFDDDLSFHKLVQMNDHWDLPSWKDQHGKHFWKLYQRKYVDPNSVRVFYKYPRYHIEELSNNKSQDIKLPSTSFKSDTDEKHSVSTESLISIIRSVSLSDSASNSISSTSLETINPVYSKNSGSEVPHTDSDTITSRQDKTHPSSTENITSTESASNSFTKDFKSYSSASQELLSTEKAEDLYPTVDATNKDSSSPSDSTSNSETEEDHQTINIQSISVSDTGSSSIQSTVSPTNDSSYSISNTPNLSKNETSEDGISSTSFKPLAVEDIQSTDLENIYSTFTDSSTQNMSHQSINPTADKTDETSTIMTSEGKDTKLTKMPKPSTSEADFQSSKTAILSTRGSDTSVSYMISSSNKDRPTYFTSTDKTEPHKSKDRLIIAEPETVIEISSIKTVKVVISVVFLAIALVATAVLTVYMIKIKRREVQYDQLTLLP